MTGASGLVGRALCAGLAAEGATYCVLSRDPERARRAVPGAHSYHAWQPIERGSPWTDLVARARAIVHLASPLVVPGRWTPARRQELYDSCVTGTRGVVAALGEAASRPEVFVCASAVAYYALETGGDRRRDEDGPAGDDFLARLTADWEAEALQAERFGVRTVLIRSSLVLAGEGALSRLRRAVRLGLGGSPLPGTQPQPWIDLEDEVGLLLLALGDGRVRGALNGVAPGAVSSAEFMRTLCELAGRPGRLVQPGWLARSRFGAGAVALTQGRAAAPARALELGYEFRHPELAPALYHILTGS